MSPQTEERALARHKLLLRDSFAFLSLLAVTAVLFGLTLALFHSFTAHRDELARRWADRGVQSMHNGRPEQAISALRTALDYAPANRGDEQLLAQALGEAGRTDESYAYFMTLWESQPGSGFINLELARLAAKRGDRTAAVEFYRASIYGTWEGDGVVRRAETRLELARYLLGAGQYDAARMELLIAAGNSPETPQFDLTVARLLKDAQDRPDAWTFYQKAAAGASKDPAVLEAAARYAYRIGEFSSTHRLLAHAEALRADNRQPIDPALAAMRDNAIRIAELTPEPSLPARENAARVLAARAIAKKRFDACTAQVAAGPTPSPAALAPLTARWSGPAGTAKPADLRDPDTQDSAMRLVFDTELTASTLCGAPQNDDALLLYAAGIATPPVPPTPVINTASTQASPRRAWLRGR